MSDEYKLIKFEVGGPGGSNTYLLVDEDTKNANNVTSIKT